ncbi:heat shock factor protein 1-like isoform X2 [Sitophilus oryzae]|uniref:Heat shock factor protein 1-like isoform X2 n=1 Tax=Sitophilus oryzae TaxID=7048 RepID=A0A6J2XU27_SITOR|nr:heat shock factor protein 1-like isoform X2 [Sitophilus oryzae]XP_030754297.1 heat shock factor protein 1-like isoform X2 [Sitophilus oryzae]
MENVKTEEIGDPDDDYSDIAGDGDSEPIINIVLPPNAASGSAAPNNGNIPLFIKKLRKMVDDDNADDVISWNASGDGFIIHDQLTFVSKTLPKYFKHNHLSSFVRQLNLYDFHKIQNVDKDEFQFSHPFFLKDVPQLMPLIKRKATNRPRGPTNSHVDAVHSEIREVMNIVKDIKNKNDSITTEMTKLRQENAALWSEMNSLRVKYSKQTKIINKLIHFLISYMQKHHNSRKSGRTVSAVNSNKYLKTGPKIMELDYKYKNNPHEFWNDFDSRNSPYDQSEQNYTVLEPAEDNLEIGEQSQANTSNPQTMSVSSTIEELLSTGSPFSQTSEASIDQNLPVIDLAAASPSSSNDPNSALQRTNSKDNLGYYIDNSQVELSSIKELLKGMSQEDMANFYKLLNENYNKPQDNELPGDLTLEPDDDIAEKELMALTEMAAPVDFPEELDVSYTPDVKKILRNDLLKLVDD